jgi:hypothetical protein
MEFNSDYDMSAYDRAMMLQNILVSACEGIRSNSFDYEKLRREFMDQPALRDLLPQFVRTNRDIDAFWAWIKSQAPKWQQRQLLVRNAFTPLLDYLEAGGAAPHSKAIADTLQSFNPEGVARVWEKASARLASGDPEGAITAARTLLETVCKHIIEGIPGDGYSTHDDMPKLYRLAAARLNLSPDQHTEDAFKQILGGCSSVIQGLATLRNRIGDAHGQGSKPVRPQARHAALAVNLAGSMATFLIETYAARSSAATVSVDRAEASAAVRKPWPFPKGSR